METIFDEVKGVYRVYNPDGSYNTYTPAQFKELGLEVVEVEEEGDADIVIDMTPELEEVEEEGEVIESETLTETEVHRHDFAQVKNVQGDAPVVETGFTSNNGL